MEGFQRMGPGSDGHQTEKIRNNERSGERAGGYQENKRPPGISRRFGNHDLHSNIDAFEAEKRTARRNCRFRICHYVWRARESLTEERKLMNHDWRRTLVLTITCLLCVAGYAEARTRATSGASSDAGSARFIVHRIPTMGKFVIVQIYVDNVMVGSIGYGGSYEGSLKPGHHVLSALATPRPKWGRRPPTTVDVRDGQTYTFTATGDGRGNLMLSPAQ